VSPSFVTENTAQTHVRHIFQELGVKSRTELTAQLLSATANMRTASRSREGLRSALSLLAAGLGQKCFLPQISLIRGITQRRRGTTVALGSYGSRGEHMAVKWPATDGNLLGPTRDLLRGLAVLEDDQTGAKANQQENSFNPFSAAATPYSLQVITAGSLAFSQQAAKLVTGLGGVAVILAVIRGIWFTSGATEKVGFIGGAAVVLAAVFVSLAIIVRSDVQARSTAQAAEYAAREHIAAAFLQAAERAQADPVVHVDRYWLKTAAAPGWQAVDHFDTAGAGLVAVLDDAARTQIPLANITLLTYASQVS
jgi:hypothetical protein